MYRLGKLTFALQHLVAMTVHFAGVTLHSDAVAVFHDQVSSEASLIATVDWGHRFPDVCVTVAEQLAVHTVIVSRAQAYAVILYSAGFEDVPDPLDEAQYEVNKMHSLGLVTDFELVWHLAKFDQEHNEIARERRLLCEHTAVHVVPQLGKCLVAVAAVPLLIFYESHLHFCMVRRRALPLSAIICGYADASLDASDNGKGDSEGSAMIFDWEGDEDFYLEPSDPTEG
jgi:hypothetical protein